MLSLLKRQRKNLGMLQESLSFQLGKASSFVSKVERAERRLDTLELIYYTQALHLDPKKFICDFIDTLNLMDNSLRLK